MSVSGRSAPVAEFNYLHITDFVTINREAKQGHDLVHAGAAGSARIDTEHVMAPVMDDLDNMRVAAYKYVRLQLLYQLQRTRRITAGITADVDDENIFRSRP